MPRSRPTRGRAAAPAKSEIRVTAAKGRIKRLVGGQGSGIISSAKGDVFFHKSDVDGQYWDLQVGDPVVFDLLDDPISGPRAQKVRAARPPRKAR
jgi:cold shock CspA family protein